MDLSALRIFSAVVREGGITRAAIRLNRVQSNVTTRIRQLEDELGVALFLREGKRLHLAPAGRVLLDYADRLLALADEARGAVQDQRPRGLLRLGAMESTAAVRLPGPLSEYHRRHPEVTLELRTGNPHVLAAAILAGELDAALVAEPIADAPFDKTAAFDEELVIVAPAGHPSIGRRGVVPRTMIAFEHGCPHRKRLEDLVRGARRHAGARDRARLVSRDARLRRRRHGRRAAAEERAHDLPGEPAPVGARAAGRRESRPHGPDLAQGRGLAESAGAGRNPCRSRQSRQQTQIENVMALPQPRAGARVKPRTPRRGTRPAGVDGRRPGRAGGMHRDAARPRALGEPRVTVALIGDHDGRRAVERSGERVVERELDAAAAERVRQHGFLAHVGTIREPAHMRAGGAQAPQGGHRGLAGADQHDVIRG